MSDVASDPYQYFRIEARELVDGLVQGVLDLEKGAPTPVATAALLRHAHTLKGAARVVKQPALADRAHAIEEILEPFRNASEPVPRPALDAVLGHVDAIRAGVDGLPAAGGEAGGTGDPGERRATARTDATVRTIRTDIAELDVVIDGFGETHARLQSLHRDLDAIERTRELVDALVSELSAPADAAAEDGSDTDAVRSTAARTSARARRTAAEIRRSVAALQRNTETGVERVDRELRDMRDAIERIRLVPAKVLFTDLERAARDVARAQGKEVAFEGDGGEVRLDAHVLEAAQSALQQAVRNAVAHGIEPVAERVAAGKAPAGRVVVTITRRDGNVVFACLDDGRGVDLDAVREVARAKGIVTAGADGFGSEELVRLLLGGGMSTSTAVTELSGRGIGLDVVRESAQRLGGEVHVSTVAGAGTTIELEVPLAVASIDVLAIEAGGMDALIPLDAVTHTLLARADDIHVGPRGDVMTVDGSVVPFVPLAALLHDAPPAMANERACPVIVVAAAGAVAALGVDRLLGTSSAVVRPLPEAAGGSAIVSGTWLDADGNPKLVLAPDRLVADAPRGAARVRAVEPRPPDPILVVDDSLTTRMLEQSILESAGYTVEVATSAEEGLTVARRLQCSLFLVDVEMPGMDGFTFVAQTRADSELRDTPAILVSSRCAPEDLQRGFDAGASAYITKGEFDQGVLLERVRELTARPG